MSATTAIAECPPELLGGFLDLLTDAERVLLDQLLESDRVSGFRHDPVGWAHEHDVFLWSAQKEILRAVAEHRCVAVHAAHALGKSFVAALAVLWWITTRTPGHSRAFTTAPTFFQVRAILWTEIARTHARLELPGRANQTELILPLPDGKDFLAAWGRKPADHDMAAFQGIHDADGVFVVVDEAAGVAATMIEDLDKNLTGPEDRILLIGNPDDPNSEFARICRGEVPDYHVIHLDGMMSPNMTGEEVPPLIARSLVSRIWIEQQERKHGKHSAKYLSRVRGMFPLDSPTAVVSASLRAKACLPIDDPTLTPVVLGIDVGAGGDWTVIQERRGQYAGRQWRVRTREALQTAEDVISVIQIVDPDLVRVDAIGVGHHLVGHLQALAAEGKHHATVVGLNVSEKAWNPRRFVNRRAEFWWTARALSESRSWSLSEIENDDAVEQLTWPTWSKDPKGRIRVESKAETIKRHGHSPDDADALLLAFYDAMIAEPDTSGLGALDRDGEILDGPERNLATDVTVDDMYGAHDPTSGPIGRALRPKPTKPAPPVEEIDLSTMFGAH